ncbi:MAG: PadR family transcriptional regulator [Planktothrix sp.]
MAHDSDWKISALEEDILTILIVKSLYGLKIRQALEQAYEGKREVGEGTLYPTLHRMEKKGYIKSHWGEEGLEERGGARRKYYTVTESGKDLLAMRKKVRTNLSTVAPVLVC